MLDTAGQRLKAVMQARQMTNLALAQKLGISRNRLSGMLADRQELDYFDMKAMRKALDLAPAEAMWVFYPEVPAARPLWL
jgi:transcriptional regulator with XRE-family HTH domain